MNVLLVLQGLIINPARWFGRSEKYVIIYSNPVAFHYILSSEYKDIKMD